MQSIEDKILNLFEKWGQSEIDTETLFKGVYDLYQARVYDNFLTALEDDTLNEVSAGV